MRSRSSTPRSVTVSCFFWLRAERFERLHLTLGLSSRKPESTVETLDLDCKNN